MAKKKPRKTEKPASKAPAKTARREMLQERFLAVLAINANIAAAAREVGISRKTHYEWMKDPDYRRRFLEARENAIDCLEAIAWERAKSGSDRLLMFLLSAYRARFRADSPPPSGGAESDFAAVDDEVIKREAETELRRLGFESLDDFWASK